MKKAAFSLNHYSIVKACLNLECIPTECTFNIDFNPSGEYNPDNGEFVLSLLFTASYDKDGVREEAVNIKTRAVFQFKSNPAIDEIPAYFYSNSIAIIFPYLRAFVSTITLQANVAPIMLPTLNMSALDGVLREQTVVKR